MIRPNMISGSQSRAMPPILLRSSPMSGISALIGTSRPDPVGPGLDWLAMRELPVPDFYRPDRVGEVWRVPYEERARDARAWAEQHAIRPAARTRSHLPARGRRPEHVLHPGLRALRRRALGHRRGRRQPAALRVHVPQPGGDHAGRAEPRHASGDAGLPRRLARRRRGQSSRPRTRSSRQTTSSPAAGG